MIIEMLLNSDSQLFFCSNDFTFKKKLHVIMYIIEIKLKKTRII